MPDVSLYIPCYNVQSHLLRCVNGVLAQTLLPREILLIDDHSTDQTLALAESIRREHSEIVRVIHHETNLGLAMVRNTGIGQAEHELVAALDADTCPDPNWLATLVSHFDDPKVCLAGGQLIESAIRGPADRWRRTVMRQAWGDTLRRDPPFVFGHSHVARRHAVEAVGGYDPNMKTNGEDHDISMKLRRADHTLIYDPAAIARHYRTDTVASIFDTYWRHWLFGAKRYLVRQSAMTHLRDSAGFFVAQYRWIKNRRGHQRESGLMPLHLALPFYMAYRLWRRYWTMR